MTSILRSIRRALAASCAAFAIAACGGTDPGPGDAAVDTGVNYPLCWDPNSGGILACNPGLDPDSASATLAPSGLTFAADLGANLDGINNAPAPAGLGAMVAGCGAVDVAGGIDDSFATLPSTTLDLSAALASSYMTGGDGSTPGFRMTLTIEHLLTSGSRDECCVSVDLAITPSGGVTTHRIGKGSITDGRLNAIVVGELDLPLSLTPPSTSCTSGACVASTFHVRLRGLRILGTLASGNAAFETGAFLAGVAFVDDPDVAYASMNATGLKAELAAFATASSMTVAAHDAMLQAFEDARDMHMYSDATLGVCSGSSVSNTDANAISVTVALH